MACARMRTPTSTSAAISATGSGCRSPSSAHAAAPEGNVQAWARELRYATAERIADGDYATGHTLSDQAETVVYRLATSPGRRALLGMDARRGRLVRPLLEITREETRDWCRSRGLEWREDPSNEDTYYARARVRHEVMPQLRELNPAAERNIAETARRLREEQAIIEEAVDEALERLGPAPELAALRDEPAALARLVLSQLAGRVVLARANRGDPAARRPRHARARRRGGVRAVVEYGRVRFARGPRAAAARSGRPARARHAPASATGRSRRTPGERGEVVLSADAARRRR